MQVATEHRMPRSMWKGAISFGLVTIPVNLYTAVREQDIHFNQIHEKCGSRIKQQLYCPVCERVVERDEIVKGYEVSKGQYVKITQEELDKLEASAGNLAVLLEDRGDRTGAIDMYQQVLNREPEYRDAHHNVARLYEAEGRYTDAIRHYSAARKLIKEKESLR